MKSKTEKTDEKLSEILAGIFLSGVIIQALFFVSAHFYHQLNSSRCSFSAGLWIGVAVSAGLAIHMYRSIDRALEMEEKAAERYMGRVYRIRAVVIVGMAAVLWYTKIASVTAAFLGVLCLMSGSHLQPFIHKILSGR